MLGQILFSSMAMGSIYALLALAMVLIYKASEVPNFAQGEMAMISAYLFYLFSAGMGWPFPLSLLAAALGTVLMGSLFEWVVLRRSKKGRLLDTILLTLGFQFVLHGVAGWYFGAEQKMVDLPISDEDTFMVGGVAASHLNLMTIGCAACVMILLYGFVRTRLGLAMRATQQNNLAARINGIPTKGILNITWMMSAAVGMIAGLLLAPVSSLDPTLMWDPVLKSFAAAVLGGMKSLPGAVLGGYLLALVENLFGTYISGEFKNAVAFGVIVAVLWFRPKGLLGKAYVRKV